MSLSDLLIGQSPGYASSVGVRGFLYSNCNHVPHFTGLRKICKPEYWNYVKKQKERMRQASHLFGIHSSHSKQAFLYDFPFQSRIFNLDSNRLSHSKLRFIKDVSRFDSRIYTSSSFTHEEFVENDHGDFIEFNTVSNSLLESNSFLEEDDIEEC